MADGGRINEGHGGWMEELPEFIHQMQFVLDFVFCS
jgi:hypothetical protein